MQSPALDTHDLWLKDKSHCVHPWTNFAEFPDKGSMVISHGDGVHVFDTDGNRFIDGIGGLWCVNIGYGRKEMAEAIARQVMRIPHYSFFGSLTNPPAAELAAKLSELAPDHLNHVFYGTGGSMANDTAIRIAHFYFNQLGRPEKKLVISREGAYHGSTYLAAALTGIRHDHVGFDLPERLVHYVSAANCYRMPPGASEDDYRDHLVGEFEDKIAELGGDNVACFIAEPIMGSGGVLVAPRGYHKAMQDVCRRHRILYVSDEVVTGFCRLGEFFASEKLYDLKPDIIVSAKGISSGYLPLGATLISDEIYEALSVPQVEGGLFTHGFTYSGHPVCCAAALENIGIMEREDLCGHVRETGPYFESALRENLRDLPLVGDVRGSHFMMCIEYVADRETKQIFASGVRIGERIAAHCQRRGLIVRPIGHLNVLSPSLILDKPRIDEMAAILRESVFATIEDLTNEGIAFA